MAARRRRPIRGSGMYVSFTRLPLCWPGCSVAASAHGLGLTCERRSEGKNRVGPGRGSLFRLARCEMIYSAGPVQQLRAGGSFAGGIGAAGVVGPKILGFYATARAVNR